MALVVHQSNESIPRAETIETDTRPGEKLVGDKSCIFNLEPTVVLASVSDMVYHASQLHGRVVMSSIGVKPSNSGHVTLERL